MSEIAPEVLGNVFFYLLIPFLFALIFRKSRISPVVGYMIGGLVIGNFFTGLVSHEAMNGIAYFGILLLLFTVGLEIQFDRMLSLKRFIIIGGTLQVVLSVVAIWILSSLFGFSLLQSALIGIALSSSSTTIVAKIIQDKGEEASFHGELAMGILMFQDLAFIPFVIIFNSITGESLTLVQMLGRMIIDACVSGTILAFAYFAGKKLAPPIFNRVARSSRELLNLFIVLAIFGIAYVSRLFNISVMISVFVAGIVVSQTLEHYHIFSQIRPFRDILAVIFFIFIGTNIELGALFSSIGPLVLFATAVMAVKALVILTIFLIFKLHTKLSTYLALYLFQIDEDAFILMSIAYANGLFSKDQYMFVIGSVLLSLILTPMFIENKELIYQRLWGAIRRFLPMIHLYAKRRIDEDRSSIDALGYKNHVIICGYGRMGSLIGRALLLVEIPFVAIDYNFSTVERAKRQGVPIIYGDPSDIDMLDYAEAEHAVAVVLAVPDRSSQEAIIINSRKLNKDVLIISRVQKPADHKRMKDLGAHVVIQPEFEASISAIRKIMYLMHISKDEMLKKLVYFKKEHEGL